MHYWFTNMYSYVIFILPALLVAMYAQYKVKSTYAAYSKVQNSRGLTGAMVARMILDSNGLHHVKIEHVAGNLTDHFDPRTNIVRLSDSVYGSNSVAACGVAAHEVGHAIQYARGYTPMKIRGAIIPVTNLGSTVAIPLFLIGLIFSMPSLMLIGILLFSLVAVFQLVTLPVEFNASNRALKTLEGSHYLSPTELEGSKKVLSAAAMTYVAALLMSIAQILRLLFVARRNNR